MSYSPQGPGWWQASDGLFYPPDQHPDERYRQQAAQGSGAGAVRNGSVGVFKRWWFWALCALVVVGVVVGAVVVDSGKTSSSTVEITTSSALPGAVPDVLYTTKLRATGGQAHRYVWTLVKPRVRRLPPGLRLHPLSGIISGTPKSADTGTYTFIVRVRAYSKANGHVVLKDAREKAFSITVS